MEDLVEESSDSEELFYSVEGREADAPLRFPPEASTSSVLDQMLRDALDRFTNRALELGTASSEQERTREIELAKVDFDRRARNITDILRKEKDRAKRKSDIVKQERIDNLEANGDVEKVFGYQTVAQSAFNFTVIAANASYMRTVLDIADFKYKTLLIVLLSVSIGFHVVIGMLVLYILFSRNRTGKKRNTTNGLGTSIHQRPRTLNIDEIEKGLVDNGRKTRRGILASVLNAPEPCSEHSPFSSEDFHTSYYITLLVALAFLVNIFVGAFAPGTT